MRKIIFAVCVVVFGIAKSPAYAAPFESTYWGEIWKAHAFLLRFNYWREDETMILHVKNGEILCYAGGKATNLWDYDLKPIVNTIWKYNGELKLENVDSKLSADTFANTEKPEPHLILARYHDPTMKTTHYRAYDLSANPKLLKEVNDTATRYCAGERAPESKTKKHEDPHQFDGKIPDPSRSSL